MKIEKFTFNPIGVNTYICWDNTGECVIIDPGCSNKKEEDILESFIRENNLKPLRLLYTHGHFDHTWGNHFVSLKWNLKGELNENDLFLVEQSKQHAMMFGLELPENPKIELFLEEGDIINAGDLSFSVIHIPGHSPGSLVFFEAENGVLFAGDVLFNGSVGRSDLPRGDHDELISGIKEKLFTLPDNTVVYPGHGPETTIGMEKKINPFLQ